MISIITLPEEIAVLHKKYLPYDTKQAQTIWLSKFLIPGSKSTGMSYRGNSQIE